MVILWNTRYMQLAIEHLQKEGLQINPEDLARLSPLGHKHINMLGRYNFDLDAFIAQGNLRPLRELDLLNEMLGFA